MPDEPPAPAATPEDIPASRAPARLDDAPPTLIASGSLLAETLSMDGAPPRAVQENPAEVIGPYRLVRELGQGGFGAVWLAEQTEPLRREVAVKIIKLGMDSAEIIARFEGERQALALMDHPNIALALDAGTTENGRPYFVMELVRGVPITEYCDAHRLTISQRLELFIPVCQAVQHAHQKAILHRDLKPSNILVTEVDGKPVPKVIDFGIAKALGSAAEGEASLGLTREGAVIGTPQYMSPEQAGADADLDTRSDIYTLGVILYELLTGGTPLPREQLRRAAIDEVLRLIREADPIRPSSRVVPADAATRATSTARRLSPARLTRTLRGDLDWITLRALEKERERRYGSAAALAQDLQRHLRSEPVEAGPPSALYRFRKLVRRNQLAVGATAALVLLLLAGIGVSTWQAVRARRAEALAEQRLAQVETEKKRGDEEAAIARAVNKFLQEDILEQAGSRKQVDTGHQPNPDLTVREALNRAARSIEKRLADRPKIEAAIRETLGRAYHELGEAEDSRVQYQRALELRTKLDGEQASSVIVSRSGLGQTLAAEGRFAEAEVEYRKALEIFRAKLGEENANILAVRTNMGFVLRKQGKVVEAEQEYRSMLPILERVLGAEHPTALAARHNLATVLVSQKKLDAAAQEFRTILPIAERVLGRDHPDTLQNRASLAGTLLEQGNNAAAESELRAVLTDHERVMGADHPANLACRSNLALALRNLGRLAEAEAEFRVALAGHERVYGPEHRETLYDRSGLALTLLLASRYPDAEAAYRELLPIQERTLGAEHLDTLATKSDLAVVLLRQGRHAEAEAGYRAILPIYERVHGVEHLAGLRTRKNLADVLGTQKRNAEAEVEYRAVLAIRERVLGAEHRDTLECRQLLGSTLHSQRKFAEAEAEHRAVMVARERMLGAEHAHTLISRMNVANALLGQGKRAEAEVVYRAVLVSQERIQGAEHPAVLQTCYNLALCLDGQKKRGEALAFAQRALAGYEQTRGAEHAETKRSRAQVARLSAPAEPPKPPATAPPTAPP